ncbi:MAG: membrane protein insertion efficiency factor YidD [Holosporales bacterium]|nr:membrane protein insertion efficiency factor YidD [Holosporales bacterium]
MLLADVFVFLIKVYKMLKVRSYPCCRFVPSCSTYAIEAIEKYGAFKGGVLAVKRIFRCRPGNRKYSNFGYDPVP